MILFILSIFSIFSFAGRGKHQNLGATGVSLARMEGNYSKLWVDHPLRRWLFWWRGQVLIIRVRVYIYRDVEFSMHEL
ncbi:hypothetical protein HOY80DRAFT_977030 [Tuber brumale]|nr:hypothetical protein HOY80DRAFT_977030 [Tuber brumale]